MWNDHGQYTMLWPWCMCSVQCSALQWYVPWLRLSWFVSHDLPLILTEDTLGVTIKTLIVSIRDKSVLILTMVRQNRFEATLIPLGVTSYDLTSQFERLAWNETTHPSQFRIWTSSIKMNLHAFKEQVVNALHWNTWQMHYHTHYIHKEACTASALTCITHAWRCINMHYIHCTW